MLIKFNIKDNDVIRGNDVELEFEFPCRFMYGDSIQMCELLHLFEHCVTGDDRWVLYEWLFVIETCFSASEQTIKNGIGETIQEVTLITYEQWEKTELVRLGSL